jgi:hypothetical protein
MTWLLNSLIGVSAMALSTYMVSAGAARNGRVQPFLRNSAVMASYVMAILALFIGGAVLILTGAARFF